MAIAMLMLGMVACGGNEEATPTPTTDPTPDLDPTPTPGEVTPTPTEPVANGTPTPTEPAGNGNGDAEAGAQLAQSTGCLACHTIDGTTSVGPTWQGLYGSTVTLADATTVEADAEYIRQSIVEPNAQVHEGFTSGLMPQNYGEQLSEEEIDNLIAYIQSLQ